MADGVEDPVEREAKFAFAAQAGALEAGKDGLEAGGIVVAPHVDDADGDEDLGMNHALRGEALHHAPGGEFVVLGVDELAGDGLEGFDEAGEIGELVEGFGFGSVIGWASWRALSSTSVAGVMVPSRCRCSSALGRRRMKDWISSMQRV